MMDSKPSKTYFSLLDFAWSSRPTPGCLRFVRSKKKFIATLDFIFWFVIPIWMDMTLSVSILRHPCP